jgi:hypothetical protein
MTSTMASKVARLRSQLDAVRVERSRQMEFCGVRLGVFARLRELSNEETRILRQIDQLAEREKGGA